MISMHPLKRILPALQILPAALCAVTPPEVRIEPDPQIGQLLSWHGVPGHTYFVEASDDLVTWVTLPFYEQGGGATLVRGVHLEAPAAFFRVWATDVQVADVPSTDFNGNGLTVAQELPLGINPLDKDPDRDGLTFAEEALLGTDGWTRGLCEPAVPGFAILSPR